MSLSVRRLLPATLLVPGVALAAPGDHISLGGDVTLAPRIAAGFEYRTNVYRQEIDPKGGGWLRLAPGLNLSAGSPKNEVAFDAEWELQKYLFVEATDDLTSGEQVKRLDRFDNFAIGFEGAFLKDRKVGLDLSNTASLRSTTADADYSDAPFTSQFRDELEGGLRLAPSKALSANVHGMYAYDEFRLPPEGDAKADVFNRRNTYGPILAGRYAFLPRTSWTLDARLLVFNWQENVLYANPASPSDDAELNKPDSTHVKIKTGLEGQYTERLFADASVGYGVGLYNEAGAGGAEASEAAADVTGLDGLLLAAQIRYKTTDKTLLGIGYRRDFMDSWVTNFIRYDYVYAQFSGTVAQSFRPLVRYSVRLEDYQGDTPRNDVVNRLDAGLDWIAQNWAVVGATVAWQQRASSLDDIEYDDVRIGLHASFTY
jgi:hypothetical protein